MAKVRKATSIRLTSNKYIIWRKSINALNIDSDNNSIHGLNNCLTINLY